MKVFPRWAEHLGLGDVVIRGIDCRWHDEPEVYRRAVAFIKTDPLSMGALVTTHKIDLLDGLPRHVRRTRPHGRADGRESAASRKMRTTGRARQGPHHQRTGTGGFLPDKHWKQTGTDALVLGAGGSAIAITWYLLQKKHGSNRPRRIVVTNRSQPRLDEIRRFQYDRCGHPTEYYHTPSPETTDAILADLPPYSW